MLTERKMRSIRRETAGDIIEKDVIISNHMSVLHQYYPIEIGNGSFWRTPSKSLKIEENPRKSKRNRGLVKKMSPYDIACSQNFPRLRFFFQFKRKF